MAMESWFVFSRSGGLSLVCETMQDREGRWGAGHFLDEHTIAYRVPCIQEPPQEHQQRYYIEILRDLMEPSEWPLLLAVITGFCGAKNPNLLWFYELGASVLAGRTPHEQ